MKKTFALAFVLFMFASTTTALAGDKRFCGYIAENVGVNGNTTIGAGAWVNKSKKTMCGAYIITAAEAKLKAIGYGWTHGRLQEAFQRKAGYKCGHISDFFTSGRNICGKKGYMGHERQGYLIIKVGNNPATFEKY